MAKLCVNIDHIATIRQARHESEPDPVAAARLAEAAGAIGITAHLREDRRHVQDHDVVRLRKSVKGKFNLEMATTDAMLRLACRLKPDEATLVPERRQELTTEGGLDAAGKLKLVSAAVKKLKRAGIVVSLFINADSSQVLAARKAGADFVEFHTGAYARAWKRGGRSGAARELLALRQGAALAHALGIGVNMGHGLTTANVGPVARLPHVEDLNIGHHLVARASLVGMRQAVKEMLSAMKKGR